MHRTVISSFADFVELIEESPKGRLRIYRGQRTHRNLLPKIARRNPKLDTGAKEKFMLDELRRMGPAHLSSVHENDWELLVTAQHFGLSTRLLDWTSNPSAALWFACSDPKDGDCYVYQLDISDLGLTAEERNQGPYNLRKTRVFRPTLNNARIVAQEGWFTYHTFSYKESRFVRLETHATIKDHLAEIQIPREARADILSSLDRYGINQRTLFPDLEGLCKYLSWQSVDW